MNLSSKIKTFWSFVIYTPFKLGDGILGKLKLSLVSFILMLFKNFDSTVSIRSSGRKVEIRLRNWTDLFVIREVFINHEYDYCGYAEPDIILDLGANIGITTIYLRLKYPRARIISIEPDPDNFSRLLENTKNIDEILCLNCAVSDEDGKDFLFCSRDAHTSSSLKRRTGLDRQITVAKRTLDSLIKENNIKSVDFIKFDIEGAEYDVFKNFEGLDKVGLVIGEVHSDLIGVPEDVFLSIFNDFTVTKRYIDKKRFIMLASK